MQEGRSGAGREIRCREGGQVQGGRSGTGREVRHGENNHLDTHAELPTDIEENLVMVT